MDIVDLPRDLFLLIAAHLSARTAVLCRRVSPRWNGVFADEELSIQLLKWHFPRCRESRLAFASAAAAAAAAASGAAAAASGAAAADDGSAISTGGGNPGQEVGGEKSQPPSQGGVSDGSEAGRGGVGGEGENTTTRWASVFASVASRYHHLRTGTPRSIEKIRHGATEDMWTGKFLPVRTWDRHLRLDDRTAPFHHPDPGWCYSQDDGLLVYHAREGAGGWLTFPWRWLDLETRRGGVVPFAQGRDRIVRRVRLADGVLIFEWRGRPTDHHCQRPAQDAQDAQESDRHNVTVYDVVRANPAAAGEHNNNDDDDDDDDDKGQELESGSSTWAVTQRTEFSMHMGLTRTRHMSTRFFSTHTNSHYAVYVWKGDDVRPANRLLEFIVIRNIAATTTTSTTTTTPGQQRDGGVRLMLMDDLDFYGISQQRRPNLRCLGMDDRNLYLTEEEHRWARGEHSSPSPPRVHLVRTTGIPIIPAPPALDGEGAGGSGLGPGGHDDTGSRQVPVVEGPCWVDECGADGDVNMNFCSRAARESSHRHSDSVLLTGSHNSPMAPGVWDGRSPPGGTAGAATTTTSPAPVGRWPGWAPCWRHEEFPYLTVSEMVDVRAGVRVAARHCFMLETLSVHVRPSLSVRRVAREDGGGGGRGGGRADDEEGLGGRARSSRKGLRDGNEEGTSDDGDEEVQFADEMWDALLGKGLICGDERWLIGEDRQGCITILRF